MNLDFLVNIENYFFELLLKLAIPIVLYKFAIHNYKQFLSLELNKMEDSTEKIQYEKMMTFLEKNLSFLKGTVYAAYGIFGALAILFTFFFFKDRSEMQAERTALQVAYNEKVKQSKEEMDELKTKNKESIIRIQNDVKEEVLILQKKASLEITSIKDLANNEISAIKISANEVANKETAKQVANVFQQDKIKKLLEDKVVKESEGLINDVFYKKSQNLVKISSWMNQFTNGNYYSNREHLENFNVYLNKEFPDMNDQYTVRQISHEIERDYETECFTKANSIIESQKFNDYDRDISDLSSDKEKIEILSRKLYRPDNLHDICTRKHLIGILQGKKFEYRCFYSNM